MVTFKACKACDKCIYFFFLAAAAIRHLYRNTVSDRFNRFGYPDAGDEAAGPGHRRVYDSNPAFTDHGQLFDDQSRHDRYIYCQNL